VQQQTFGEGSQG